MVTEQYLDVLTFEGVKFTMKHKRNSFSPSGAQEMLVIGYSCNILEYNTRP